MIEFLTELDALSKIPSVSGAESGALDYFYAKAKPLSDEVRRDRLGNVLALKGAAEKNAPLLLIDAHADEIGFLVAEHCGGGFVKIKRVGGSDPALLPGSELLLYGKKTARAVVGAKPPHLIKPSEREKKPMFSDLYVDTLCSEDAAKELFPVGTPAGFADGVCVLQNGRVASRGLDNRVSGLCLLALLERLDPEKLRYRVAALWSIGEECGGPGAMAGAYGVLPDLALCVDVGFAAFPGAEQPLLKMGGGAGVSFSDTLSRTLSREVLSAALSQSVPVQVLAEPGDTGTNAHEIHITAGGIPTAVISIPLSYMHTPSEVVSLDDLSHTVELLAAFAEHGAFSPGEVVLVG